MEPVTQWFDCDPKKDDTAVFYSRVFGESRVVIVPKEIFTLEEKLVGYLPITDVGQTMHFRSKKFEYKTNEAGRYLEDFTFKKCLKCVSQK